MLSLRTKTIILNTLAISVALIVATVIGAVSVANQGHESSEQSLSLLCETGKNSINYYFKSVEQSVNTVSSLIDEDIDNIDEASFNEDFSKHIEEAKTIFNEAALNTNGVLTYYYRIDPEISKTTGELGFWYVDLDGNGFKEHEVTDLTDEQFEAVWFKTPKETGQPVWLPPYLTDNLDVYVLSYNVPVFRNETTFIGVVGIEISYTTMGEQIKDIKVQKSGYAFIIDNTTGYIIYHPQIDVLSLPEDQRPSMPSGFVEAMQKDHHIGYTFNGVSKHAYWKELGNGMDIVVTVPISEVNQIWLSVVTRMIIAASIIISFFVVATILFTRHITKPLVELTKAAEKINEGDYNVSLDYKGKDEIGVLTQTVNKLVGNLGDYINDLNHLAYADTLTKVNNKAAFDLAVQEMQKQIEQGEQIEFAIGIFDCDDLKGINDSFGHDKGNVYLRNSCHLICRVFENSDVYRLGGDEFAVILKGKDYIHRNNLKKTFFEKSAEICAFAKETWEKIKVSVGIAVYDPDIDKTVGDVIVHADHLMYENKRSRKKKK